MTTPLANRLKQALKVMQSSLRQGSLMSVWPDDVRAVEDALAAVDAAAMRDRSAKVAEGELLIESTGLPDDVAYNAACHHIPAAIRALAVPPDPGGERQETDDQLEDRIMPMLRKYF